RDPARQALRPACEELAARIGRECPRRKRGPRPKTAAVERREARTPDRKGVPRRLASAFGVFRLKRVHARLDALCTPWVPRKHPRRLGAPLPLIAGANYAKARAHARRGDESGCLQQSQERSTGNGACAKADRAGSRRAAAARRASCRYPCAAAAVA